MVDTGRGIAPEHLANIFRPFCTTKGNGTGLGLSMARRTVEDHQGRIEVTSEIGKGARFLVVLSLLQAIFHGGGDLSLQLSGGIRSLKWFTLYPCNPGELHTVPAHPTSSALLTPPV